MGNKSLFGSMYWKISGIFMAVLLVFASITLYISINASDNYSREINQEMNRGLAGHLAKMVKPFLDNGEINNEGLEDLVHSIMVVNPSIEVYLLNDQGKILSYAAPEKVVKLTEVGIAPIHAFIAGVNEGLVYGDDPRNPGQTSLFSAATVKLSENKSGFVYTVLASQEYVSAADMVVGSYILGLSTRTIALVLILSAIVGLFAIWFITKRLRVVVSGISAFGEGELTTRIEMDKNDELGNIAQVFNTMADTIENNIEELKGVDRLRKELIGNISHDLRTPVAAIQGYAETLELKIDKIEPEEQARYLGIITKSCHRLQKLVNDLFDLSKLEAQQIELKKETFPIGELVHDVANKYRLISQKKGISINTTLTKESTLVKADLSLIDRVLQNLIDNAIKFCKDGDTINVEVNTAKPGEVEVKIIDSGAGIQQKELPHIFDRYYKGQASEANPSGSTGLGLAIVKKIIDLHDANIEVKSVVQKGTSFRFCLPAA